MACSAHKSQFSFFARHTNTYKNRQIQVRERARIKTFYVVRIFHNSKHFPFFFLLSIFIALSLTNTSRNTQHNKMRQYNFFGLKRMCFISKKKCSSFSFMSVFICLLFFFVVSKFLSSSPSSLTFMFGMKCSSAERNFLKNNHKEKK